ncbi:hypothetical protein [Puia dinghuensis]|uniref:Uncharacterized protein n=1 Tax=Puia dinghuensis TaxID=1792502 RepID=A0A8J2XQY7_9BACT|nr:hypothetical protein [Puia dinghuensis]GGA86821.1 hypothetical protein GCM10011511_07360 [Puia dinghuensis]
MPTFDVTLNIYVFILALVAAVIAGYLPRSKQISRKQRKIIELEREMVQAHAELLENQREYCLLEAKVQDITNPVIPMKGNKLEEPQEKPLPESRGLRNNRPTGTD